ncbi:Tom37 C-terminal domain-containing protein [Xylaria bambusicola]|uniref:Tom37 C-terminal domain-containing protein n=1 Tax=Xylaria bambusicola TaxID=326684 RepID=UPI002007C621|nr:Tom37 C-terminal domain-containing protein [Xylaria bambusicola]KAI0513069.1 Tom37 C-terminal domain-containing protein [Xylaria bambusicola]
MSFELHVWGPALGRDSIDAECLAAIAAFRHIFAPSEWSLIASNDTYLSPEHTLPALFHGGLWTSGYTNIISYLTWHTTSCDERLSDNDLTSQQEADLLAYSSYLSTRGSGLIALSLYASPNAWVELTRPAYSELLPFPLTWTIPTTIRAAAIDKAESLGMGYIAAEAEADEAAAQGPAETTSTGFLRLRQQLGPRKSMQPEQTAAIRFQQLADDFFTTLDELQGAEKYLLQTSIPSSLDFLAYGYLELMQVQTPFPILARSLMANGRPSAQFLQTMRAQSQDYVLPWEEPAPLGLPRTMLVFADGAIESIAGAGESWRRWRRGGIENEQGEQAQTLTPTLVAVGSVVAGLAAAGAAVILRGIPSFGATTHRFEAPKEEKGLHRFGEIGAMLDVLPIFDQPPTPSSSL